MPSDRHTEGLAAGLTVRENAALAALPKFAGTRHPQPQPGTGRGRERPQVARGEDTGYRRLGPVALRRQPAEGGHGAGASLRAAPDRGRRADARRRRRRPGRDLPDPARRLERRHAGPRQFVRCGRARGTVRQVVVMSRGRVVETLRGADVVRGAHRRGSGRRRHARPMRDARDSAFAPRRRLASAFPAVATTARRPARHHRSSCSRSSSSPRTRTTSRAFNLSNILLLATALGFIALGQTVAILLGRNRPLGRAARGLPGRRRLVLHQRRPAGPSIALGFALMLVGAVVVGAVNGSLIRFANFTPIAATLAMYIGLQGLSFLLRDGPDGYISYDVIDTITWRLGPIPVAFVVMIAFAIGAEYCCGAAGGAGSCGRWARMKIRLGESASGSIAPSSPPTSSPPSSPRSAR